MTQYRRIHCHSPPPSIQLKIDDHQRWLRSGGTEGTRLGTTSHVEQRLNLEGLMLDGLDLSLGLLDDVQLSGSSLRGTWLLHANLRDADLSSCDLTGARLDFARMEHAILLDARYPNATFQGVDVGSILWTESDLKDCDEESDMKIKKLFESRKNWTSQDHSFREKRIAKKGTQRDPEDLYRKLAEWRQAREILPGPQP